MACRTMPCRFHARPVVADAFADAAVAQRLHAVQRLYAGRFDALEGLPLLDPVVTDDAVELIQF